ncbi:MAG: D-alanyl-D-alanine carboxypeptidase [Firmicutes bacterium]|nr:D-alanyl-D-alanine carboxypeptidase [Bacillota bacterium]
MFRKILWYLVLLFAFPAFLFTGYAANSKPVVNATAAVLIEHATGKMLYAKNSDMIMAPASTTKIMTAIIGIEKGKLDQPVVVSATAASKAGSSMYLVQNEKLTLKDLLYGLLMVSGNDAATAIAEHIAGSESKFAEMMTAKARSLGLKHTQFKNSSGLPARNHYTTAYDLAMIARYALQNTLFSQIVKTKVATVPSYKKGETQQLINHNKLLWRYPYTTGIKTGYTAKAGRCLVASAKRDNITLIAVVLKSSTIYTDSKKLFEYGFKRLGKS